ncbi:unnamed protein product [Phytophthora fragariaefolia]|uniref:Unnamed protein product n=1 Tax=Phytophthora fragariaefolia TaxID=1490495 RepID=A0A9W6UDZ9_9STRA|nr:unnamed protein product [Phytophthora fragariaefolia]
MRSISRSNWCNDLVNPDYFSVEAKYHLIGTLGTKVIIHPIPQKPVRRALVFAFDSALSGRAPTASCNVALLSGTGLRDGCTDDRGTGGIGSALLDVTRKDRRGEIHFSVRRFGTKPYICPMLPTGDLMIGKLRLHAYPYFAGARPDLWHLTPEMGPNISSQDSPRRARPRPKTVAPG